MKKAVIKRSWLYKASQYICAAASAVICVWCMADNLLPILQENGKVWLFRASGLEISAAEAAPLPQPTETPRPSASAPPKVLFAEEDGVLGAWEEPQPAATPDPERETGRVEILKMNPGEPVDCFTVKDSSESGLDLSGELKIDPDISVKKNGSPVVLLYSTHTTESFILHDNADWFYLDDDFRSQDPDENIVSVAAEAAKVIEAGGFGVIHDTTIHDYPAYSGSYSRSMETIQKNLEAYPTIRITIDVHRDAFGQDGNTRYKPVAEINGKNAAQIMILTGCDLSEDPIFPDWRENLHLALRLQQAGETLFPGLYRPLYFCQRNYNMHATNGSLLVEVGTDVNTLGEAQYSGRLLGETILAVLEDLASESV